MTPNITLPYQYASNPRAGTATSFFIWFGASIVMAGLTLFGVTTIPWAIVALPAAIMSLRIWLYSMLRNAVHEALRLADADYELDGIVETQIEEQNKRGLTPGFLNEKLIG